MKYLALLLIFGFGLSGFGQTIKSLGYNSTNGIVVYTNTNTLTFPSQINVGTNDTLSIKTDRIQSSFDDVWLFEVNEFGAPSAIFTYENNSFFKLHVPLEFIDANVTSQTRTNLGIGLPALTNTSNVTMMRALSGSTNTNEPFSGEFFVPDVGDLYFSNGVLLRVIP